MAIPDYALVARIIARYKDVGEVEAKLFARLMERQRFTIENVKSILKELKEKKANSRAYQLLDSLKKNELIYEIKKSNPKTFRPIHPRVLLEELKDSHANFEESFGVIEQAYETFSDTNDEATSPIIEVFSTEPSISSKLQELINSGFVIKKIIHNDENILNLFKKISKSDLSKIKVSNGTTNYAVLEKKDQKISFILFNIETLRGPSHKEGLFITNSGFASYL